MKHFLKPVKFNVPEKDIFFWGCLHLNHDPKWEVPLWKMRGYNSASEHFYEIKENWKCKLDKNSIIFLLGDTVFGHNAEETVLNFFKEVPFQTCYMMGGNHTAGWKQLLEKSDENCEYIIDENKKLILIPNYFEIIINGHSVVLSHYPIVSWNGQGKGAIMLHAHVHGSLEKSEIGKLLYKTKIKEVSVEKTKLPLSFNEIKRKLDKLTITYDHHGPETNNPF
jgi:calcineurin-like phosphoesterase family protein